MRCDVCNEQALSLWTGTDEGKSIRVCNECIWSDEYEVFKP